MKILIECFMMPSALSVGFHLLLYSKHRPMPKVSVLQGVLV